MELWELTKECHFGACGFYRKYFGYYKTIFFFCPKNK